MATKSITDIKDIKDPEEFVKAFMEILPSIFKPECPKINKTLLNQKVSAVREIRRQLLDKTKGTPPNEEIKKGLSTFKKQIVAEIMKLLPYAYTATPPAADDASPDDGGEPDASTEDLSVRPKQNDQNTAITKTELELAVADAIASFTEDMTNMTKKLSALVNDNARLTGDLANISKRLTSVTDENVRLNLVVVSLQEQIDNIKNEVVAEEIATTIKNYRPPPTTKTTGEIERQASEPASGEATGSRASTAEDGASGPVIGEATGPILQPISHTTAGEEASGPGTGEPAGPVLQPVSNSTSGIIPRPVTTTIINTANPWLLRGPMSQTSSGPSTLSTTTRDTSASTTSSMREIERPAAASSTMGCTAALTLTPATRLTPAQKYEHIFLGFLDPKYKESDIIHIIQNGAKIDKDLIQVKQANIRPSYGNAFKVSVPNNKLVIATTVLKSCHNGLVVEQWREPTHSRGPQGNMTFRGRQQQQHQQPMQRPYNNRERSPHIPGYQYRNNFGPQAARGPQRDNEYDYDDNYYHNNPSNNRSYYNSNSNNYRGRQNGRNW